MDLLAAEITARTGKDPGEHYRELTAEFGAAYYTRIDAPATPEQKARLAKLSPEAVRASSLAGEPIIAKLTRAPGQRRADRRPEGRDRQRLVRGPAVRHREHLQDLRRELQGRGPPRPHRRRSPGDGKQGAGAVSRGVAHRSALDEPHARRKGKLHADREPDRLPGRCRQYAARQRSHPSRSQGAISNASSGLPAATAIGRSWSSSSTDLGYRDYLGALQRYRVEHPKDIHLLSMSSYLVDYPFANRLYPGALDVLERLRELGTRRSSCPMATLSFNRARWSAPASLRRSKDTC